MAMTIISQAKAFAKPGRQTIGKFDITEHPLFLKLLLKLVLKARGGIRGRDRRVLSGVNPDQSQFAREVVVVRQRVVRRVHQFP